jgi:hypothetical protein
VRPPFFYLWEQEERTRGSIRARCLSPRLVPPCGRAEDGWVMSLAEVKCPAQQEGPRPMLTVLSRGPPANGEYAALAPRDS